VFSATDPDASSLTVAPPEAFGFLGHSPAPILVDRGKLEVPAREAFSLVGGDITVDGGGDAAPIGGEAGTLRATAGEITLAALGEEAAGINLDRAFIDTTGDGGGTISIRGGRLLVEDNSKVLANNIGSTDAVGGIEIEADSVDLSSGSIVTANASGSGTGGKISVNAKRVQVRSGGVIGSDTLRRG
jgi:hypothetical protein